MFCVISRWGSKVHVVKNGKRTWCGKLYHFWWTMDHTSVAEGDMCRTCMALKDGD